jgi:hypothetical protein
MTIRIPQRIRDAIEAQADAERRSAADIINNVLEKLYPTPTPAAERRRR